MAYGARGGRHARGGNKSLNRVEQSGRPFLRRGVVVGRALRLAHVYDEESGVEAALPHLRQRDLSPFPPSRVRLLRGEIRRDIIVRIDRDHIVVNGPGSSLQVHHGHLLLATGSRGKEKSGRDRDCERKTVRACARGVHPDSWRRAVVGTAAIIPEPPVRLYSAQPFFGPVRMIRPH